jgi:predicted GIY-YIG superfamily endonuclease
MGTILERPKKNGSIRYQARIRLQGGQHVGKTFTSLSDAERWQFATEERLKEDRSISTQVGNSKRQQLYQCGVYLLWKGLEIVYIGHSNHIVQRVVQHAKERKVFDSWSVVRCRPEQMLVVEKALIVKHQPVMNKNSMSK